MQGPRNRPVALAICGLVAPLVYTTAATAASLQREREMIDCINRGIGGFERLGGVNQFVASDRLRPEQKRAVQFVLDSRHRAVNICGAAGAGKTATLRELGRGLIESGG